MARTSGRGRSLPPGWTPGQAAAYPEQTKSPTSPPEKKIVHQGKPYPKEDKSRDERSGSIGSVHSEDDELAKEIAQARSEAARRKRQAQREKMRQREKKRVAILAFALVLQRLG